MNKTDKRESGYCRVKVEGKDLSFYGKKIKTKNKNFWVYAANPEKIKKPTKSHPIVQSYVDLFIGGCFQIKVRFNIIEFTKQCVETTT